MSAARRLCSVPLPALIALAPFLVAYACDARADTIGINTVSMHSSNSDGRFNELNLGVYYKHSSGFGGGVFDNSLNRLSAHADYTTPEWHYLSLTAGLATGYCLPIVPIAMASVRIPIDRQYSLRVGYVPASWADARYPDVATLMLEKEF
jgi:hypothetical protein